MEHTVILKKAVRLPHDRKLHNAGETIVVNSETLEILKARDLLQPDHIPDLSSEPTNTDTVEDSEPEIPRSSTFPPLPKKTAPVAEWKEYARLNETKLTGLTKRNEIIGYLTRIANSA